MHSVDIDSYPIEELELGVRAYNILKRMNVNTIGEFRNVTANDLNDHAFHNFDNPIGLRAAREIGEVQERLKKEGW